MKNKVLRLSLLMLVLVMAVGALFACTNSRPVDKTVVHVEVLDLPADGVYIGYFDQANIKMKIVYDDGSQDIVPLRQTDLPAEYQTLLTIPGEHEFAFLYSGIEVSFTLQVKDPYCTVTFLNALDQVVKEIHYNFVEKTPAIVAPTAEEMAVPGYRFTGEFDKSFENITADTVIKGIYVKTYVVTFYNAIGEVVSRQTVDLGASATAPTAEQMATPGYRFTGEFDKSFENITTDTDIHGIYVKAFVVTFYNAIGEVVSQQTVDLGASATAPTAEQMATPGYRFTGEFDKSFENITADTDIHGIYVKTFVVTFYNGRNQVISTQTVDIGMAATEPTEAERYVEGYVFRGWDVSFADIQCDLNVYGIYLKGYLLVYSSENPDLGSVSGSVESGTYLVGGTSVMLSAQPQEGCQFLGWYKDGALVSQDENYTFVMLTKPLTLVAKFEQPQQIYSQGLEFISNGDGTCYVASRGTCKDPVIIIPPVSPKGEPVVAIGEYAFYCDYDLYSITIPESVAAIGNQAFRNCYKLVEVINHSSELTITKGSSNGYIADNAKEIHSGKSKIVNVEGYLFYTFNRRNYLLGYAGEKTALSLPQNYNGENYEIYQYAFCEKDSLTSVTIPAGVTFISSSAFYRCSSLASVTFAEGSQLTSIGSHAFYNCSSLTSVTIPAGVTFIGDYAFFGCRSLTSITIPAGVTSIGSNAFNSCSTLASVIFAEGSQLTSIGRDAFYGCSSLTSITIPASVTSIDYQAFYNCSSLASVIFAEGSQLTSIDWYAFQSCRSLASITIPAGVTSIDGSAFSGCSSLASVTFAEGSQLTSIGSHVFYGCRSLTSITILASVTSIGIQAFYGNTSLQSVIFAEGSQLTSIGNSVFSSCSSLTSITIPASVTSIGSSAFEYCPSLESVIFAEGSQLTSIGNSAFRNCSSLTSITIPAGVTSIGDLAFLDCTGLESIAVEQGNPYYHSAGNCLIETATKTLILGCKNSIIPADGSVAKIGDCAFENCSSLTSITIPASVTSIGSSAFYGCSSLTSITIPAGVTSIGNYAFYNCYNLIEVINFSVELNITKGATDYGYIAKYAEKIHSGESIIVNLEGYLFYGANLIGYVGNDTELILPESYYGQNYRIHEHAFFDCRSLTSITIPASVTTIGNFAFYGCSSLENVIFAEGSQLTSIGNSAFYGCRSLTSITIPASVTSIGDHAFVDCTGPESIVVKQGNPYYHSAGNCLIETATKTLILGCKNSIIPADGSVTSIGDYAFYNCSSLTSITIPTSVTSIGVRAFSGCSSLASIIIPAGVTSIGSAAFSGCSSLTFITIPASVTSIGNYAFEGCSSLTFITIPASVTSIGNYAFEGCSSLASVIFAEGSQLTSIGQYAFYGCSSMTSITIPAGVTSIGDFVFSYCRSLTSITIPAGVTSIGQNSFSGCSSLESVTFAKGSQLTSIGYHAFDRCSSITSITIPAGVTSIGSWAFYNCSSLKSVVFEDISAWYRTTSSTDWKNQTGGVLTGVGNPRAAAQFLCSAYISYYWYKL